jgi:hypothetical protein
VPQLDIGQPVHAEHGHPVAGLDAQFRAEAVGELLHPLGVLTERHLFAGPDVGEGRVRRLPFRGRQQQPVEDQLLHGNPPRSPNWGLC